MKSGKRWKKLYLRHLEKCSVASIEEIREAYMPIDVGPNGLSHSVGT